MMAGNSDGLGAGNNRRLFARYDPYKRLLDVTVAIVALVVLLPLMAVVAALAAATLGRPILFRQERSGRYGRPFVMVKFRTMRPADPEGGLSGDTERLTTVGRVLRTTSLDELPTLWNVLLGQMSLVGPRPLLVDYLDRYTLTQARRHEVRPGVTGLAQVRGRTLLGWEERFALDVWYVDHRTFVLDACILARTVWTVLSRDGVAPAGTTGAGEFLGASGVSAGSVTGSEAP